MKNYREVLNAIFNRNEILNNLYSIESLRNIGVIERHPIKQLLLKRSVSELSQEEENKLKELTILSGINNKEKYIMLPKYYPHIFIKGMIDAIDTFQENKYKFIICLIGLSSIKDYIIHTIGIDKIIEILFNTNYNEEEFSRIIASYAFEAMPFNFQSRKKSLFMSLLNEYFLKGEFDVLKKLLSIRDMSIMDKQFITTLLEYFMSFDDFKLLKFLLDNKKDLLVFIRILKNINEVNGRGSIAISKLFMGEPIEFGTSQQREELFRNV